MGTEPVDASTTLHLAFDHAPLVSAVFVLDVVEGRDRGLTLRLDGSEATRVSIGTSPSAALRLSDRSVSRRHAALEVQGARLRITDLDSKNGVTVNGVRVIDAWLSGGESVRIGSTAISVERANQDAELNLSSETCFGGLMGASREMRRLHPLLARLAKSDLAIIIEGETGTGKEVLAEALHDRSTRAKQPFVVFDCTSVPSTLLESELFGHERGAFTGALERRTGLMELADGGSLFIDEIGELALELQPKLLRAIERSEFRRIGSNQVTRVDVRIIAATRRDLDREVAEGRFRDDLFHRLGVGRVELPPLRKRPGDVTFLALHFLEMLGKDPSSLPRELLSSWESRAWNGNVRELRNAVARYVALGEIALEMARPRLDADASPFERVLELELPLSEAKRRLLDEFEHRYLERVLSRHSGNVSRAAAAAGVGRRYLHKLLARERVDFTEDE